MWGSLLMGVSLLISLPWYIVPSLETMLLEPNQLSNLLFCLLHPFSAGVTVASATNAVAASSTTLVAAVSMVGYLGVSGFAGNWILKTVKKISTGADIKITRETATDLSIKPRSPLFGYVLKDLKSCSRNPATAFFFALPVLETVIVSYTLASFEVLRASTLLVSTLMGGVFVLLMPLALLNSEGKGLEYTKTLPLNLNRIVTSKTLVSTLTYVPVPLVLLVLAFLKPITSPLLILIPFFSILSIASASVFEIQLFLSIVTNGKISALIHDLKKLIVGITTLVVPLLVYAVAYVVSSNHLIGVFSMGIASTAELALAFYTLKRTK
jgi:predicted permease